MRIGKRSIAGLLTASLLFSVPGLAIHQTLAKATGRVTHKQQVVKQPATAIIQHNNEERLEYNAFAREVRAQFRGQGGDSLKSSVNRYLKNVLLELRRHWRTEARTGVASNFNFPDV